MTEEDDVYKAATICESIMALVKTENGPAPESYGALLGEIKERIRSAPYAALRAVNRELIDLYWDIGRLIIGRQSGETWGRSVVQNPAKDLQLEFPGVTGFSAPNLYKMRQCYEAYRGNEILSPLVREISWTKNLVILERRREDSEREFYLRRTKQLQWICSWDALHNSGSDYLWEGCPN